MNKKKTLMLLIGVICIVVIAVVLAIVLNKKTDTPDAKEAETVAAGAVATEPGETTQDPATGETTTPTQTNPATGETTKPSSQTEKPAGTTATEKNPGTGEKPAGTTPTEKNPATGETTVPPSQEEKPAEKDPVEDETTTTPPQELPPTVEIPTVKDPATGEDLGVTFPCKVPDSGLVIEKMAPYSGMFVEDGTNANVENVAMLMVRNQGDHPVEYTQIRVECGQETLLFDISALPVGEYLVVQEKNGKTMPEGKTTAAAALVVQRADMEMSKNEVQVTDNGNNTLTIRNLTNKTIPTVRVFYKYYMEDEALFVGGIAFTVRVTRLGAGANVTIQPSHYTSDTSRVVMVLTYDSEV